MIKRIIKRNGTVERFDILKPGGWLHFCAQSVDPDLADISGILIEACRVGAEEMTSSEFQRLLITISISRGTDSSNKIAGKLYASLMQKEIFPNGPITVKEQVTKMVEAGLCRPVDYTDAEYERLQAEVIDHDRDMDLSYYSLQHIVTKYALGDKKKKVIYETPQFACLRMAMELAMDVPVAQRVDEVKAFYDELSFGRINAPTPNWKNLGTHSRGLASCCLYAVDDTARSIAVGHTIVETMTYMSAGIGGKMMIRSVGDQVRNGSFLHQGKHPYQLATKALTKANLQGSRGGASTEYIDVYDPEIRTMVMYQNPRTPVDKQIRGMHFCVTLNPFFVQQALKGEEIFLFNSFTAPALYAAFSSGDHDEFEIEYEKCLRDDSFKKTFVNARELLIQIGSQCWEVATVYLFNISEANTHTPFSEVIYTSNLCTEITNPTKPYQDMVDLYTLDHHRGEVGLCSLGGIVYTRIPENDDAQYLKSCKYALKMIDYCIHSSHYELPHVGYTAKMRMNAAVGLLDVANHMAQKFLPYNSKAGLIELHKIAERHSYHMIRAALELGIERGNAPWINKTKWPAGWLPIDTYNRNVDSIAKFSNVYDWEKLRAEIIDNGGIRFSSLVAHMPTESSSKAAGAMNGIYPARQLSMVKTDGTNAVEWTAPGGDVYGAGYQMAWELSVVEQAKFYAIFQKWADQSISADFYRDRSKNFEIKHSELLDEFAAFVFYGLKSRYYSNSLTGSSTDDENQGSIVGNSGDSCAGGSCTL